MGTGPSLKNYKPIENAIHISVNRFGTTKFCSIRDFQSDYHFISDNCCMVGNLPSKSDRIQQYGYKAKIMNFYGRFKDLIEFGACPSQSKLFVKPHMCYDNLDFGPPNYSKNGAIKTREEHQAEIDLWDENLENASWGACPSTIFKAFQFAMYCGFTTIKLVGCDCTDIYSHNKPFWDMVIEWSKKHSFNSSPQIINLAAVAAGTGEPKGGGSG